jgi:glycosyltransferase involved in cell wall biosynthesis
LKIAYFTPVSPQKTGITDYSEKDLLPYLSRYAEIDIFIDKGIEPTDSELLANFDIHHYSQYEGIKDQFDVALYHMGNNGIHEFIYDSLLKYPGITVLHDIYLHGFLWSCSISRGDKERYLEEFEYCHGLKGLEKAKIAMNIGVYPEYEYPLIKRIVDSSYGIVCHSEFGVDKTIECNPEAVASKINMPLRIPDEINFIDQINTEAVKKELGIDTKHPVITSFGFISAHKRYPILLGAFRRFLKNYPNSILLLVGEDLIGIDRMISSLGLEKSVKMTGYAPFNRIIDYLAISDFCVNLRYPTAGETSSSVLRIMGAAKPVIVSNTDWFSEIPDSCCLKVDIDSYEEETLLKYMEALASDEQLLKTIGKNAQEYIIKEHDPDKIAKEYYKFITNILNGNEQIMSNVSGKLVELGINWDDEDIIKNISRLIKDLL